MGLGLRKRKMTPGAIPLQTLPIQIIMLYCRHNITLIQPTSVAGVTSTGMAEAKVSIGVLLQLTSKRHIMN